MVILLIFLWSLATFASASQVNICIDDGYVPVNGYRKPKVEDNWKYFVGSKLNYYCNEGYGLNSSSLYRTCTEDSSGNLAWSPLDLPGCVKECGNLVTENGETMYGPYREGDVIYIDQINCLPGYERSYDVNVTECSTDGTWTNQFSCKELGCSNLTVPFNGNITYVPNEASLYSPAWQPGTLAFYECASGAVLIPANMSYRRCEHGQWSGFDPSCIVYTCPPPEPILNGVFTPELTYYQNGDQISYHCNDGTHPLGGNVTRTCLSTGWTGTVPHCGQQETTTVGYPMFCLKPHPIENGYILCCEDVVHNNACCPTGGKAQFECEPGYELHSGLPEIKCYNGEWVSIETNTLYQYPTCVPVESTTVGITRANAFQLSDDMIRTVIGVAAGVLSLLLLVIALAFCKPKLKDMKRRWRDMREDENGLIVNGQRVVLPSYEEATACTDQLWFDAYNRVGSVPPPLNSLAASIQRDAEMTRPPESNLNNSDVIVHRDVTDIAFLEEGATERPALAFEDSFLSFFDGPPASSVPSASETGADSPDSACALLHNHDDENDSETVVSSRQDMTAVVNLDSSVSVTQQTQDDESLSVVRADEDGGNVLSHFLVSGGVPDERSSTTVVLTSPDHLHTDSTSV